MLDIPPALPPAQYSKPPEITSDKALEQMSAANNLTFDVFEPQKTSNINKDMKLIAHRGYSSTAPENTIPAFIEAAKKGYKFVECDISWTKDDVPVLLHDSTINRTAARKDGGLMILPRYCSSMTYDELLSYDFGIKKGEEYENTNIPTFEEFLKCCREYNLSPYIELKEQTGVNKDKIKTLIDLVDAYGLNDKVTWISFNYDYLKTISELDGSARLGYLYSSVPVENTIKELNGLKTENNEVFLDAKASKLTQNAVSSLNEKGYDVEVWTVDDFGYLDLASSFGCSGVTTDNITSQSISDFLENPENN